MTQGTKQSFTPAVLMTIGAFAVFGVLLGLGRPTWASIASLLAIEGAVLLACSIQPNDPTLWKTWRERLFGTTFAEPVGYVPLFFYLGQSRSSSTKRRSPEAGRRLVRRMSAAPESDRACEDIGVVASPMIEPAVDVINDN
jgi:hypothetical protein